MQQLLVIVLDLCNELATFLLCLYDWQQVSKTDNGIQRSTYFMTHIGQEGSLQTVTLLSLIPGSHKRSHQFFALIDTLGSADDLCRLTLGITVNDGSIAFFPVIDTRCLIQHLILLMIEISPSLTYIFESPVHMIHICRSDHSQRFLKVLVDGRHIVITPVTIVFLK